MTEAWRAERTIPVIRYNLSRTKFQQLQAILATFLTLIACSGCGKSPALKTYQAVVANVTAGTQAVSPNGEIVLPANQASSTVNGKAYATTRPTGGSMILFPTRWGKGTNLCGYLYCPGPAIAVGSSISVNVPIPGPVPQPQFGMTEITVDSVVAPGWYDVSRSLD